MPAPACGLVILPPTGLADILREAQNRAGPAYVPAYPPHLTLKNLFVSSVDAETVARAIAGVCASARPFTISLGRLTVFPSSQGNFIVLRVAQARQMMRLHRQLLAALDPLTALADPTKDPHEEDGFVPHITLLQRVPDCEVADVMAALVSSQARRTFRVEQISLICQAPGCPWQETQRFPLGDHGGAARPAGVASIQTHACTRNGGTQP
jgi:2'-5' RNA ligase